MYEPVKSRVPSTGFLWIIFLLSRSKVRHQGPLATAQAQSWLRSKNENPQQSNLIGQKVFIKNFALSYLQKAYPADLVPLWSKLFSRDQKWSSRTSKFYFSRGRGIIVVASAFRRFIFKLDIVTSNFLNIFVQDCSRYMFLWCNNTYPWTIPFANPRCSAIDSFDEMWR